MWSSARARRVAAIILFCGGVSLVFGCATPNDSESEKAFKRVDLPAKERVLMKNQIQQTGNYSALGSSFRQNNSQTYRA